MSNSRKFKVAPWLIILISLFVQTVIMPANFLRAQTLRDVENVDISNDGFRLVVCDGPVLPKDGSVKPPKPNYVPCDFPALMKQAQHIISIMLVLGVVLALAGFVYAGALMMTGVPKYLDQAKNIFPTLIKGFIIMVTAWFIVYQILSWLGADSSFTTLMGNPK